MKSILKILLIILAVVPVLSQTDNDSSKFDLQVKEPVGQDFWLCFMMNYKEDPDNPKNALLLELFLTGDKDANVTIEVEAIKFKKEIFVPGGTVKSVVIDPLAQTRSFEIIERGLAVHVTATRPISVYGLNRRYQTTDTYLGLPINVLGKEYRVMCYHVAEKLSPTFAIVGVEDNTIVDITPIAPTSTGRKKDEVFQVTLNKGDVYQVKSETQRTILKKFNMDEKDADMTGTHIKANKNIAVFSGHECTYVPAGPPRIKACNHLVEQIPPTNSWGKHFYIGQLKGRSVYTYRVLADKNDTKVFENSKQVAVLKAGQYFEKNSKDNLQITADKPVLVSQYSQGFENGDAIGDPMMLLISPTQQFLTQYRFATPVNGSWNHYINVVVPNNAINTIELNGQRIDPSKFEQLGLSRYSIAFIQVPFGTHYIRGNEPFGLYSYGFGFGDIDAYDAYGNMGGQSFLEYIPKKDVNPPLADVSQIDGKQLLMLRDDRTEDTGIKSFKIIDSIGISLKVPSIQVGVPQVPIEVFPEDPMNNGRIIFEATDASNNSETYTLCYIYDVKKSQFGFFVTTGVNKECFPDPGFIIGAFGKYSINFHDASFSKAGNVDVPGKFSSASGSSGIFGLYINRKIASKINLVGKLSLENIGGTLTAPDSIVSNRRDPITGNLLPFQESHNLEINSMFVTLSAGIEYTFMRYLYLTAGINVSFMLDDKIDLVKKIIIPDNYVYLNGSNTIGTGIEKMNDFKSLRFGLFGGIGSSINLNKEFIAFIETNMNYYPMDIISSGNWTVNSLSFLFGLKYRL